MPIEAPETAHIEITAAYPIPKSWSKKKRAEALEIALPLPKDLDNVIKFLLDTMNGICYTDDRQVTAIYAKATYEIIPYMEVKIWHASQKSWSRCPTCSPQST